MKNDRFLLGILIFIGLLVAAALFLVFSGDATQSYKTEDSPESIVYNYALAVTQGDYERAYGYLAEGSKKPSFAQFRKPFSQYDPLENIGLRLGDVDIVGREAFVAVTVLHGSRGPFDSGYRQEDSAVLELQDDVWRIKSMPYPYWEYGWLENLSRP